ncbi:TPA: hypothetical protein DDW69_03530 [candidate division CPR2 bacterium]|uniref:SGNH hydrolase-type esterase domain-containing protein n=1 Tax=candidate division CPR2 bacterium GW2011_GWC1_41_48 TaxID=1618344 RepID=A0A0G0W7U4_UNCC2|nr:MAG: hypothetical protein UT47_C0003G0101 [candidate division CPR2 bacterium GW2011_GWC2_39_35]KKR27785.1 MAG: hypothetical protein UT59_C0044G0012 [candidate division CPR2 bacterium GW2011_GWD1_39_7]KKR28802.1 MAG: hypothetical protein UT60_C0012G0010 [candidate division CPR2 bacterium GW2011_GWD2_39_7]KKS09040.1 MAG: hypothetical protein UU65_C0003G0095 [candidate division CPR2 bacterium GW2011_GWC1_41_48]OGB59803.1 MAG: hypothetical protein A2Y27_00055 [candidate division CPR2 bacterium G
MPYIFVLGSSISYGCWDAKGGWANRLRSYIDEKNFDDKLIEKASYWYVYNLSNSGDTSEGIKKRFEAEVSSRMRMPFEDMNVDDFPPKKKIVAIFSVGLNDSAFSKKADDNKTGFNDFKSNIKQLVDKSKDRFHEIVFVGPTPVLEEKVSPFWLNEDLYYKNKEIEKYNDALKEICQERGTRFINVYPTFMERNLEELIHWDGLHPNAAGHKFIYNIVRDYLIENEIVTF